MTDTLERTGIDEALAIIDRELGQLVHRELVSSAEVVDVLLDVRSLLADTGVAEPAVPVPN